MSTLGKQSTGVAKFMSLSLVVVIVGRRVGAKQWMLCGAFEGCFVGRKKPCLKRRREDVILPCPSHNARRSANGRDSALNIPNPSLLLCRGNCCWSRCLVVCVCCMVKRLWALYLQLFEGRTGVFSVVHRKIARPFLFGKEGVNWMEIGMWCVHFSRLMFYGRK